MSLKLSLQRPAWGVVDRQDSSLEAYKHKFTVDKRGKPIIIRNYYEKTGGLR